MDSIDYDDTLPLPADVEREFMQKGTDQVTAIAWLSELEIDPQPILKIAGRIAAFQWTMPWDQNAGRYGFQIYEPDHVGPKGNWHIAVPIAEGGAFRDLLLVDMDVLAFTLVCGRAKWLGREELGREKAVRLHRTPVDWLESGCRGVVHVEPISRRALRDLRLADEIRCSNIHTALEAWSWGFGDDDDELGRFVIDDSPENIRSYFAQIAKFQALAKLQQSDLWPRSTAGTR